MKWTKQKPKVTGWYWWKMEDVLSIMHSDELPKIYAMVPAGELPPFLIYGPIPPPPAQADTQGEG